MATVLVCKEEEGVEREEGGRRRKDMGGRTEGRGREGGVRREEGGKGVSLLTISECSNIEGCSSLVTCTSTSDLVCTGNCTPGYYKNNNNCASTLPLTLFSSPFHHFTAFLCFGPPTLLFFFFHGFFPVFS
jgi:hypothetical protein